MTKTTASGHIPVLVEEVLFYIHVQDHKTYLDVTFGAGGHTRALLEKSPTCKVVALDWDKKILERYGLPLQEEFPDRLTLIWGNFAQLFKLLKKHSIKSVDGILADFGTSQVQIVEEAGFSIYRDTPLDMRMSPAHQKITAADVLQHMSEHDLKTLFQEYGEERYARRIAHGIVQERTKQPFRTTTQLAEFIKRIVPTRQNQIHPATRVFQALRIYVNKELDNIRSFLATALTFLSPGGRLVCISFHSLEDRLVKQFFKEHAELGDVRLLTPKVVKPTEEEIAINPSSRSARLRAVEKR